MKFEEVNSSLSAYPALESASFLQGMLVGLFCGKGDVSETTWIKNLLQEANIKKVKESLLKSLHDIFVSTKKGLNSSGFEFELCLADDEQEIMFRTALLAQWSEGFLYGFGLSKRSIENMNSSVAEFIQDIQEITRLDIAPIDNTPELEEYIMEITEFIRIGSLMINEELNPKKGNPIIDTEDYNKNITLH